MRYNHVVLMGRLTRDPELSYAASGKALCRMGLAVDQGTKEKKETGFYRVTVFGGTADVCAKFLKKGRAVLVAGRLNYNTWTDKDGNKRNDVEVLAFDVEFVDSPKDEAGDQPPPARADEQY